MQVGKNKVVSIDYTLKNTEGQVLDSSNGKGPLVYLHGQGNIIPGLESALEGKKTGENVNVVVPPGEGYGERDDRLVQPVPRASFKGIAQIEAGMKFQAQTPQGPRVVTVVALQGDEVVIDANHPLAGMPLSFDVTVQDVRDASAEEIEHGHVHGPGGHHH